NGKTIAAAAVVLAVISSIVAATAALGGPDEPPAPRTLHPSTFSWLDPGAAPAGWSSSPLPDWPARLPLPPGWRRERGDAGTRTESLRSAAGRISGYLNATPRQGSENARDWSSFRLEHNRDEGEREVTLLAGATNLRFRAATGSCVLDSYTTESGNRYRELACIVSGASA